MQDKPQAPAPSKGWQRVTPKRTQPRQTRETFRIDAPSPAQEVLAKHDAALNEEPTDDDGSTVICF